MFNQEAYKLKVLCLYCTYILLLFLGDPTVDDKQKPLEAYRCKARCFFSRFSYTIARHVQVMRLAAFVRPRNNRFVINSPAHVDNRGRRM